MQEQKSWASEHNFFLQVDQNINLKRLETFNSRRVTCSHALIAIAVKANKRIDIFDESQWRIATVLPWALVWRFDLRVLRIYYFTVFNFVDICF